MAALVASKQLRRSGSRYLLRRVMTVDTRPSAEDNRRLKLHRASVALERFATQKTGTDALFSFNLFAISDESFQQLRALHLAYYQQARELIAASKSAERVVVMNLQLVPLAIEDLPLT